jgi:hypothetical protein
MPLHDALAEKATESEVAGTGRGIEATAAF